MRVATLALLCALGMLCAAAKAYYVVKENSCQDRDGATLFVERFLLGDATRDRQLFDIFHQAVVYFMNWSRKGGSDMDEKVIFGPRSDFWK